ncbi:Glutamate receptor ionotropic, kainate 2 [Folsomia candida]|uniref:Glutamate receptor ionotropic, kainate 2 n=1 Tax=Folsomia candida TaxID=158441 RepID=A0A226F147_FOLCA|nr:Glutamate receptor ionotropic, kainate 2 [Folsomia candida]
MGSSRVLLHDDNAETWVRSFESGLADYDDRNEKSPNLVQVLYRNESDWEQVILDFTRKIMDPETQPQKFFATKQIPYFRVDVPFDALLRGVDSLLHLANGSNGFMIFHSDLDVNRGVNVVLGSTLIRYSFLTYPRQKELILEKFEFRVPTGVIIYGTEQQFKDFIQANHHVVRNRTEWIFMYNQFMSSSPPKLNISFPYFRAYFSSETCCTLANPTTDSQRCSASSCDGNPSEIYIRKLAFVLAEALNQVDPDGKKSFRVSCTPPNDPRVGDRGFNAVLMDAINAKSSNKMVTAKQGKISFEFPLKVEDYVNGSVRAVGEYKFETGLQQTPGFVFRDRKRYFRIGIVNFPPWTMKDEKTGEWVGYCIDLANGIANKMNFEYDLVVSEGFGKRMPPNGRWNGLTGDLKIDIAVAAYIMTSEREEFIDFVSPYYEQSGLIITMKRPVVKNSLFKFMTVLRTEVWLSILGATIATGFMLWFLDKFSPYSAQNNPQKYKTFRKFTLKESFWFALTSFTPQGGGEPPKAFSGRTLVAAYWIFVVLMLATFTANLAAFLTVERMQSPIRNLEHLAAQSSVKYSVVNVSTAMTFFKNMANAEEILYQMWRNLTLTAPSSAREYVVWEYPIREMYIHIHSVIQSATPVLNMSEGFSRVLSDDYFAFIHDAAQTKYEVFRNCNLTLIGEPFAEAPYALAVAQGNPLQDDISMAILQLQTERFFETLSARYWTSTCPG